ncbi:hypothetical protein ACP4OV_004333 [Aristida adscensionis]
MKPDHILEVPDTPDRIQQPTCPVSVARRDITTASSQRRRVLFKTRNSSMTGPSIQGNTSSLPATSEADHIFRQAEVARNLPLRADVGLKLSSQKSDRITRSSFDNEKGAEKYVLNQGSSILNHISGDSGGRNLGCQIREVEVCPRDANHWNTKFIGVGSGLPTSLVEKPQSRTGTITSNRLKVVASDDDCPGTNKAITGPSSPSHIVPQRNVGQKRLVRNGCISPSNLGKRSVEVDEKRDMCSPRGDLHHRHRQCGAFNKGNVIDLTDSPVITRQGCTTNNRLISANNMDTRAAKKLRAGRAGETLIPQSEDHANSSSSSEVILLHRNNKGKQISHDILDSKRIEEANTLRACQNAEGTSIVNNSTSSINSEQGWRTTRNHTSKLPISSRTICSELEPGSSAQSNQDHKSTAGGRNNSIREATTVWPESFGNKTRRMRRGTSLLASASSHPGESSGAFGEPGGSFLTSSNTAACRNRNTHQHDIPLVNIDDSNPTSVDPTIQAQLEYDELLARQLQEQLYNESPHVAHTEEIDAILAMSLQQEEGTRGTTRAVRRSRDVSGLDLQLTVRFPVCRMLLLLWDCAVSAANRSTKEFCCGKEASLAVCVAGAAFARYPGAPHSQPNIDLNDYDALLALDENNDQHTGASGSQINNLPESVVQSNSVEEPCAVCLENLSAGETIRHLPCFHKFHKECIDKWLKRKKMCPVCKSGI